MAVQRVRSDVDRTRLFVGAVFIAVATVLIVWLARAVFQAGRIRVAGLVYLALFSGLFYLGLRLLRPKDVFDIDVERREYVVIRNGVKAGAGSLDELGPLQVREYVYRSGINRTGSPLVQYIVSAAIHSQIELCQVRSAGQRLRDDAEARKESPLRPEWGIRIEPLSLGYAMHSTLRSWTHLASSAGVLIVGLYVAVRSSPLAAIAEARESHDLFPQILLGGFAVIALAFLGMVVTGVRDAFFPGTVRITDRGVSYRFSRMAFREIEELTASHPIELIGDRRSLELGATFCRPGAVKSVAHELQRLIIEVAEANPHAR
jgi:hypothetical protein